MASLRDEVGIQAREARLARERIQTMERDLENALGNQNRQNRRRYSPKNYLKSSPDSSVGDKSESELSKKFASKNNIFFDRDMGSNDGSTQFRSIPNSRYKHVGSSAGQQERVQTGHPQRQGE